MKSDSLPRGTVLEKAAARKEAAPAFPTPADSIDWKKSNVVKLVPPAPPPKAGLMARVKKLFGKG